MPLSGVGLDLLCNPSRFDAVGADADALDGGPDEGAHHLQIGSEKPLGLVVGVADRISNLRRLTAK